MQSPANTLPPRAGLGLKPQHVAEIVDTRPDVGFFEVHAENYMGDGGPALRHLEEVADSYPLSLHGVGLSIGGSRPLDRAHLSRLRRLVDRYRPARFSEHLAWSTHECGFLNDLLPLPYTRETLDRVCAHVDETQQALGCRMLLENPSTYVVFSESTIDEIDFLDRIAERTGCGLLLDVNNVMVTAVNHGLSPLDYVDRFPTERVGEIHLAGYDETVDAAGNRLLVDAHGSAVRADVIALYVHALARCGPVATLIEWDNDVPAFPVLLAEAAAADRLIATEAARRTRRTAA
jgi:uncharacterized protein (UPF0276 family)